MLIGHEVSFLESVCTMQISEHRCAVVSFGVLRPEVLLILGITVNALYNLNFCKIHCADFPAPAICKPQSGMKEALPLRIANMKVSKYEFNEA